MSKSISTKLAHDAGYQAGYAVGRAIGKGEGRRLERRAILRIMKDCYEYNEDKHYWYFNSLLFKDRLETLDARRTAKRKEGR